MIFFLQRYAESLSSIPNEVEATSIPRPKSGFKFKMRYDFRNSEEEMSKESFTASMKLPFVRGKVQITRIPHIGYLTLEQVQRN